MTEEKSLTAYVDSEIRGVLNTPRQPANNFHCWFMRAKLVAVVEMCGQVYDMFPAEPGNDIYNGRHILNRSLLMRKSARDVYEAADDPNDLTNDAKLITRYKGIDGKIGDEQRSEEVSQLGNALFDQLDRLHTAGKHTQEISGSAFGTLLLKTFNEMFKSLDRDASGCLMLPLRPFLSSTDKAIANNLKQLDGMVNRQTDQDTKEKMRRAVDLTKATHALLKSKEPIYLKDALEQVQRTSGQNLT